MCTGSRRNICSIDLVMEEQKNGVSGKYSNLLELSATDDVAGFVSEVEGKGVDVDESGFWYGRRIGSKKMGFERRTPLMIAATYGSTKVLEYIVQTKRVDVNRKSGSDGATALHCAAAGGSFSSIEVVKMLLEASADVNLVDADGNKPGDLIARHVKSTGGSSKRKVLEMLLKGFASDLELEEEEEVKECATPKKEYPVDISLPDINNGVYGSDEFRMYSFKVKPCSRAYSHDWTECPFVHPGENARRRDPKKLNYSCVPCPEFRKGSCVKGDGCEYAHGVFESWLHPAQYRTRLCKDEIGCARKVCFFAHRVEELRPLYASTGSAMPSPKSGSMSSMDMGPMSPLGIGSTPPLSPSVSSPMGGGNLWQNQNKINITPPTLQLQGSRLKTALNARDFELELELMGLESIRTQQRQQLIDDLSSSLSSSPSRWNNNNNNNNNRFGEMKPANLDDVFGSLDQSMLSQMQGLSPRMSTPTQLQSPTGLQMRQNSNQQNQLRSSYPSTNYSSPSQNYSSSPVRKPAPTTFGFDSSSAVAQAVMNSRSAAFAKRSQSFIDRRATLSHPPGITKPQHQSPNLSEWGSPDGKLEWGFNGDDHSHNKLTKSASFGYRNGNVTPLRSSPPLNEPDVSWVNSLVKDVSSVGAGLYSSEHQKYGGGVQERIPAWAEQLYIEQEQMVA